MIIKEGSVEFEVLNRFERGPGFRGEGFYNKEMQTSRDFTVSLLKITEKGSALDAMAGTGIRGLRIKKETDWDVVINDINKHNVDIIQRNANINNIDVEIWNKNFFSAVSERKWDYIDLDPYGSPSGFVESSIYNLKNNGILGVTMTDTANLEGRSLQKGYRIYGGLSRRGIYSKELSTRIFLGYLIRIGASLGYGGKPLLVIREKHYIRCFVKFKKGSKISDQSLNEVKDIELEGKKLGPMYAGKLYDPQIISSLEKTALSKNSLKLSERFQYEDLMFLFFTNIRGREEIGVEKIINSLVKEGFKAGRTNFFDKGIKTDAKISEFYNIISKL